MYNINVNHFFKRIVDPDQILMVDKVFTMQSAKDVAIL